MKFNIADSAVNTAIANSLLDLSNTQKLVATAVFGFSKKLGLIDTDKYKIDEDTKSAITSLNAATVELNERLKTIEDDGKSSANNEASALRSLDAITTTLTENPEKNKMFNKSIDSLNTLVTNAGKNENALVKLFDSVSVLDEVMSPTNIRDTGIALTTVALGITLIGAAMYTLLYTVTPKGIAATALMLGSIYLFSYGMSKLDTGEIRDSTKSMLIMSVGILTTATAIAIMSLLPNESILKTATTFVIIASALALSSTIVDRFGTSRTSDGQQINYSAAILASSVGILALSIFAFNVLVHSPSQLVMPLATITGMALAFALINMIPGRGGIEGATKGLLYATSSIAILALSIFVWDVIEPEQIAKPLLAVGGLVLGLTLMAKFGGEADFKKAAVSLIIASASVAALAGAIYVWDQLGITAESLLLPGLAIGGLMVGLHAIAKVGSVEVIKAAGSLIIAAVAVGGLGLAVQTFAGVDSETMIAAGLFTAGIATVLGLLGAVGPGSLMGAGALAIAGGAVWLLGKGALMFKDLTSDDLWGIGLFATGIGTIITLLGLAPWSLLGAASLAAGGGALWLLGKGIAAFKDTNIDDLPKILDATKQLADLFYDIGGPIDSVMIGSGAAAMLVVGGATYSLAKTLVMVNNAKLSTSDVNASVNSIALFIDKMLNVIQTRQPSFFKTAAGIMALAGLGNMVGNLADGLVKMGQLTFVEYGIKDDKIVPIGTRKFTTDDFNNVGIGIKSIINALREPLADVGKDSNIFGQGDVGRGIKQLTGLGNLVKGIAEGVAGIANLQFTEYEVIDGKLVPVHTRKFSDNDFKQVGISINSVVSSLTTPLAEIGKSAGMFRNSDVKRGIDSLEDLSKNVFKPIQEIVTWMNQNAINASSNSRLKSDLYGLITAVTFSLDAIAGKDYDDVTDQLDDIYKALKNITSLNSSYSRTASHFRHTANSLTTINNQLSGHKLQRILTLRNALNQMQSTEFHDNFLKLIELIEFRLAPLLTQMNDTLASTAAYAQTQPGVGQDMSFANDTMGTIMPNSISNNVTNNNNQSSILQTGLEDLKSAISELTDNSWLNSFMSNSNKK